MRIIKALRRAWETAQREVAHEEKIDKWYTKLSYEKKAILYERRNNGKKTKK